MHTIDKEMLQRIVKIGGRKLLMNMAELFRDHTRKQVAEVENTMREGNYTELRKAAHSIRSSAGNIGAMELYDLAGKIENAAVEKDEKVKGDVDRIGEVYKRTEQVLDDILRDYNE